MNISRNISGAGPISAVYLSFGLAGRASYSSPGGQDGPKASQWVGDIGLRKCSGGP